MPAAEAGPAPPDGDGPGELNATFYTSNNLVPAYAREQLQPIEATLLERNHQALRGRVLEVGCGTGRVTRALVEISPDAEIFGIDISPEMLAYCAGSIPGVSYELRDMREVVAHAAAPFDAVIAPHNVIDAVDHADRVLTFAGLSAALNPGGLLIFSSHNRGFPARTPVGEIPRALGSGNLRRSVASLVRLPRRLANHRRLRRHEVASAEYEIRNDSAHDYALLHYCIDRDAQRLQLSAQGFELLACVDPDGEPVAAGESAEAWPSLHYVACKVAVRTPPVTAGG